MRYSVSVSSSFSSAHRVRLPSGDWEPLHGHNYRVEVCVSSDKLDDNGMVIDFHLLKKALDSVVSKLHNSNLNENSYIASEVDIPTAENLGLFILKEVEKIIGRKVSYVKIYETDDFFVVVQSD